jgi:menaquinone-dependent protoporphyrinogen IX oxidase
MKQAVLYYSIEGHSADVAKRIAQSTDSPVFEIIPAHRWTGFMTYPICGYQAMFRKRVMLMKIDADLKSFDRLIVVSPIHAGRVSAAVRSFLFANRSFYTDVKLVLTHADKTNTYEDAKVRLEKELMFQFSEFESIAN